MNIKPNTGSSLLIRRIGLALLLLAPVLNFASIVFAPVSQRSGVNDQTYIDAAGYAFSIWGFIFLWMIGYGIFQVSQNRVESPFLRRASWGILLAALALNLFVPVSFLENKFLTWAVILLHLLPLIVAYQALRKQFILERASGAKWAYAGVSVFIAWISAAFIISTTQTLIYAGVAVADEVAKVCALVLIGILTLLAFYFWAKQQDGVFVITIAWAFTGITVEQWEVPIIGYTALGATILLVLLVTTIVKKGITGLLPDVRN